MRVPENQHQFESATHACSQVHLLYPGTSGSYWTWGEEAAEKRACAVSGQPGGGWGSWGTKHGSRERK
eukprot:179983-Alexandrium_andersonii.AAC.1